MNKENYNPIKVFFLFIHFAFYFPGLYAQVDCYTTSGGLFGQITEDIHGSSLALDPDEQGFYLGGMKNDSAMIIRFDQEGEMVWARTLDVVPNRRDNISTLLVDSDNMIVIGGTNGQVQSTNGGSVYILRYDPYLDQVLWAFEFVPSVTRSFCWMVMELSPGGNFLMANNPVDDALSNVDAELIEISRTTGIPVNGQGKRIHLGGSEDITNMVAYNGSLYGTGRFTDGLTNADMRSAVIKMDMDDRDIQWAYLGHIPSAQTARLYGVDLAVHNDFLYTSVLGDPSGTSTTNTKVFVQKVSPDGMLIWLKQYDFPGNNDWAYEMISHDGGIVILAAQKANPIRFILFKLDDQGDIIWSRGFPSDLPINFGSPLIGDAQLIASEDYLVFTGYTQDHLMVIMTDPEGYPLSPCIPYENISINVLNVANPILYEVEPEVSIPSFSIREHQSSASRTSLWVEPNCFEPDTLIFQLDTTVCYGESVEGYSTSGIYQDAFVSHQGCDSIRILALEMMDLPQGETHQRICPGEDFEGYTVPGIYHDTVEVVDGCDIARTLYLGFDTLYSFVQIKRCIGDSVESYGATGIYQDTFVSFRGCDSIRTLDLQLSEYKTSEIYQSICPGMIFESYTYPGVYQDTFGMVGSCDSIRTLYLAFDTLYAFREVTICEGESAEGYTQQGLYEDILLSANGCDSIRTIQVNVIGETTSYTRIGWCEDTEIHYTEPGVYQDTLVSSLGCDSIRILEVDRGSIYIPNVFSPNGDGVNDYFEVTQSKSSDFELTYFAIFDRYGNMAYETTEWPVFWKGDNNRRGPYNPGVFAYILRYFCGSDQVHQHGTITLIR